MSSAEPESVAVNREVWTRSNETADASYDLVLSEYGASIRADPYRWARRWPSEEIWTALKR